MASGGLLTATRSALASLRSHALARLLAALRLERALASLRARAFRILKRRRLRALALRQTADMFVLRSWAGLGGGGARAALRRWRLRAIDGERLRAASRAALGRVCRIALRDPFVAWRREANQAMFLSMRESFVPGPHHASTVFGGSGAVAPSKALVSAGLSSRSQLTTCTFSIFFRASALSLVVERVSATTSAPPSASFLTAAPPCENGIRTRAPWSDGVCARGAG